MSEFLGVIVAGMHAWLCCPCKLPTPPRPARCCHGSHRRLVPKKTFFLPPLRPPQARICDLALPDILLAVRHHPEELEVVGKALVALGVLGQGDEVRRSLRFWHVCLCV